MSALDGNGMRWRFQPGHFEVWYATFSHLSSRTGFWIRYTIQAPDPGGGEPYGQLWFARFDPDDPKRTFGINRRIDIGTLQTSESPFRLRLGEAELRSGGMSGALEGKAQDDRAHAVEWDLSWRPAPRPHLHLPSLLYRAGADTTSLVPNADVAADGRVVVDGETYLLAGDPLGQAHLWGRKHVYSWAWAHCNAFSAAPGALLEAVTVRLRRGPLVSPKLTLLTLELPDEGIRAEFREPWRLPLTRSEYGTGRYQLRALDARVKLEAELTCRPEDMILAEYLDPDGDPAFCHNTACASAEVKLWRRSPFVGRFRAHRSLRADRVAHFEWGARAGDPLVRKRHHTCR